MKRLSIFLITLALIAGTIGCSSESNSNPYTIPQGAVLVVNETIGNVSVEYWERVIDGVFHVKNDYVLMDVAPETNEIVNYTKKWRDISANLTSVEVKPFAPPGGEYFWKSVVVFLEEEDVGYFYSFYQAHEYPLVCWEVRYSDGTTVMYDLDGNEIGYGIPAPSDGFSLSGYCDSTNPDGWKSFRENADAWFQRWSGTTTSLSLPTPTTISSYVSDPDNKFYYALAHGAWNYFQADKQGSYYIASDAVDDMQDRAPMLFAFIGHCEGMTSVGPGSFSDAFRKGSMTSTVTVGYSGMGDSPGWPNALDWQDLMFERMNEGDTIWDAFLSACAQYPLIADDVEFWGDKDLSLLVHFCDPNLEAAVREAIDKPNGDIYQSDLLGLTSLNAFSRGIVNIAGLEHCINLENLMLEYNNIVDLKPLSNLNNLHELWLRNNKINDINPLSSLTNLRVLCLDSNEISNLQPLSGLSGLEELFIQHNRISDISLLSGLINLRYLSLMENQINDIGPLSGLTNLVDLRLGGNEIASLQPLSSLTNLATLYLWYTKTSNVSPLSGLVNLRFLLLSGNQITDLGPLSGLTSLKELTLDSNQISDISPLSGLIELTELCLDDNQIANITPLSTLTKIGEFGGYMREGVIIHLGLSNNQIGDINGLVENGGLDEGDGIDLRGNPLSAVSLTTYIPQLEARGIHVLY